MGRGLGHFLCCLLMEPKWVNWFSFELVVCCSNQSCSCLRDLQRWPRSWWGWQQTKGILLLQPGFCEAVTREDFSSVVTQCCSCMAEPHETLTLLLLAGDASTTDAPCPTPKGADILGTVVWITVLHTQTHYFCIL